MGKGSIVFFQEPSYIGHDLFALPSNVLHLKERIRVCQCYHGNPFYHILATDYSLLMVDERFPTRPVGIRTNAIWAVACDFQQCGILTSVDSDKPVQPTFKLRNSKWWSVNRLTFIEYSSEPAKALISLRVCAGLSEALLVTHTTSLEISCCGSYGKCSKILNTYCLPVGLDKWCRPRSDCFWRSSMIRYSLFVILISNFVNSSPENHHPIWGQKEKSVRNFRTFSLIIKWYSQTLKVWTFFYLKTLEINIAWGDPLNSYIQCTP